jgi:hypothetical protein
MQTTVVAFPPVFSVLCSLLLAFNPLPLYAQSATDREDAETLLPLAESLYPDLFSNGSELRETQGYTYRLYAGTGVYVGIKDHQVYLLGGPFGNAITAKGSTASVLALLQTARTNRNQAAVNTLREAVTMNWNINAATTTGAVRLTHLPMNLADMESITPLGLLAAGHVTPIDHIYFNPVDFNSAPGAYPVYVVADGLLTEISTRANHTGTGVEYRVVLQHTGTFYSYYDLIDELDPAIANQIPAGALDNGKVHHASIAVSGGQLLGRIGGKTLDFANVNLDSVLGGYINPISYLREPWKIFTVDTFDSYDEPLRSQLLGKNKRVTAPRGGKIDQDISGALVGNWFRQGTNGYAGLENDPSGKPYWAGHLAIVPYALDPAYIVVSVGDFDGEALQFGVRGNAPDPATVTSGYGVLKWELTQPPNGPPPLPDMSNAIGYGTALFEVLPGDQLKAEFFPGLTPDKVSGFTAAAQLYVR